MPSPRETNIFTFGPSTATFPSMVICCRPVVSRWKSYVTPANKDSATKKQTVNDNKRFMPHFNHKPDAMIRAADPMPPLLAQFESLRRSTLRRFTRTWVLVSAIILVGASAFGSGFSIFEQGAKATAMGGAFCATADDPSAIFYNVAGIAQQRHMTVLAGATFINFANEFKGDPNDPFASGTTGQYKRHTFIPPNVYA